MAEASLAGDASETQRLSRKAILHVGLLLGSLGLVAYLDRISVAFAGPHGMNQDLSLTATAFGFVVGIFTIGYVLFEIPSAGFVTKWGPRRWIVRVMLTWGVIQCLTAFAPNFELMLIGRFMLGVAEAGFTPAVYYLFSKWFIRTYRPLVLVIYSALLGVASVLGPTISGLLSKAVTIWLSQAFLDGASFFSSWVFLRYSRQYRQDCSSSKVPLRPGG